MASDEPASKRVRAACPGNPENLQNPIPGGSLISAVDGISRAPSAPLHGLQVAQHLAPIPSPATADAPPAPLHSLQVAQHLAPIPSPATAYAPPAPLHGLQVAQHLAPIPSPATAYAPTAPPHGLHITPHLAPILSPATALVVGGDPAAFPPIIRPRATWKSAWAYCTEMQSPLRCGNVMLDAQLPNGLTDGVWDICGRVGAGKTWFCLAVLDALHRDALTSAASSTGGDQSRSALYIDTIGALSPQLLRGEPCRFYRAYSPQEIMTVVRDEVEAINKGEHKKYRLAVVDSLSFPFRAETDFVRRAMELGVIEQLLRKVADVILVTNHLSGPESTPLLGKSWTQRVDHRVILEGKTLRLAKSITRAVPAVERG